MDAPETPGRDENRNRPSRLNHKHLLMLHLVLAGKKTSEIASILHYHPNRVSTIINSPLFKAQLEALKAELQGMTFVDFLDRIRQEVIRNFEFKVQVRDNDKALDSVRLQASRDISADVDRLYPKVEKKEEERTIRVVIDDGALQKMVTSLAEATGQVPPAIDVNFKELPLKSVEEFEAELAEAELQTLEDDA